ncbi:MAG TPA: PAS domain S-box protein [Candidatus Ozemobacteraceae bacterium]
MLLIFLLATTAGTAAPARTATGSEDVEKIVVGIDRAYPPYEFTDQNGQPTGFTVELARLIASSLSVQIEFRNGPWSEIIPDLQKGRVDLVAFCFSVNRTDHFCFSEPLAPSVYTYFRRSDTEPVRRESDLVGRHVVLQRGDMMDDYLSESSFGRRITRLDDMRRILRLVSEGKADYALVERRIGRELVREMKLAGLTDTGSMHYVKDLCFGSGLSKCDLIGRVNQALRGLKTDGRYQALWKKWFGGTPIEEILPEQPPQPWGILVLFGGFLLLLFVGAATLVYQRAGEAETELRSRIVELSQARSDAIAGRTRLRAILANTPTAIILVDAGGRILESNERFQGLFGYSAEEAHRLDLLSLTTQDPAAEQLCRLIKATGRPEPLHVTGQLRRRDGTTFWVDLRAQPLLQTEGIPGGFVIVIRDVHESKELEAVLRENETRYRKLAEGAPDLIYRMFLPSGRFEYVNPAAFRITGCTQDEFFATPFLLQRLIPEDCQEAYQRYLERLQKGMAEPFIEYPILHREGTVRWLQDRAIPVIDDAGRITGAEGIIRDITTARRVAEELQRSEANLRAMFHSTKDGYVLVDRFGTLVACNPPGASWLAALGRTVGSSTSSLRMDPPPACWPQISADLDISLGGTHLKRMLQVPRSGGGQDALEINLWPVPEPGHGSYGVCLHIADVTERERIAAERRVLDEKVRKTQKYESLGILAGGIAHDFNNLLTGILGAADLARRQTEPESMLEGFLDRIISTARRASELTQQMLAYSGKSSLVLQAFDLAGMIRDMGNLLEASIPKKCRLEFAFSPDLPPVMADLAQMRQVLLNLVMNAAEAIGERAGSITIRTGMMICTAETLAEIGHGQTPEPGTYVFVEVQDDGSGMDAPTQAHIFEPFFSTKFTGRGLGLAAVLGIVQSLRGAIRVESQPGTGSRFTVLLPASVTEPQPAIPTAPAHAAEMGSGLVLVVDDEEFIRILATEVLTLGGYTVETADNGAEALEMLRKAPEKYAVILLDLTMPGMDGTEAFAEIRRIAPAVPIIISSGYSESSTSSEALAGRAGFLQKPYAGDDLLNCVNSIIGRFTAS